MVFQWSLNDSKSSQVSRTLPSILADLNNAIVWIVSTNPKSSSPITKLLGIFPSVSITIGITVTFMFHSFISSLTRSKYLSFFSLSLIFTQWSAGTANSTILQAQFFFSIITWSCRLAEMRRRVYISKFQRNFCVSLSRKDFRLCIYYLLVWSNLNFLHNSEWITLSTQSCLVLNSFCANLLQSLII